MLLHFKSLRKGHCNSCIYFALFFDLGRVLSRRQALLLLRHGLHQRRVGADLQVPGLHHALNRIAQHFFFKHETSSPRTFSLFSSADISSSFIQTHNLPLRCFAGSLGNDLSLIII